MSTETPFNNPLDTIEDAMRLVAEFSTEQVAKFILKTHTDKHTYKNEAESLEGIRHLKNRRIAELEAQVSRLKNDLQDCWEAKAQIEERLIGGAM